jgi:hypothetical protein
MRGAVFSSGVQASAASGSSNRSKRLVSLGFALSLLDGFSVFFLFFRLFFRFFFGRQCAGKRQLRAGCSSG